MKQLVLLVPLAGCVSLIEEHDAPIGDVVRDCVVPGVTDAPVGLEYPDHSLWIWEDASARVFPGECEVTRDAPVLALSAQEIADNEARTDGKRLALRPTGGVVAGDVGYLYYEHVVRGPGFLDEDVLGTALCVIEDDTCARVSPDVMWAPDERVLNRGGIVVDGRAVIAGCRTVANFLDPCTITGVPVADITDPAAYQPYQVFDGWVDDLTAASVFTDAPAALTIAAFDGAFVAVSMDIFENRVEVQRSTRAEADYGHKIAAFDVTPPEEWFVRGGREHSGLREQPHDLVVSYDTDDGLHLVTFRVTGDLE